MSQNTQPTSERRTKKDWNAIDEFCVQKRESSFLFHYLSMFYML